MNKTIKLILIAALIIAPILLALLLDNNNEQPNTVRYLPLENVIENESRSPIVSQGNARETIQVTGCLRGGQFAALGSGYTPATESDIASYFQNRNERWEIHQVLQRGATGSTIINSQNENEFWRIHRDGQLGLQHIAYLYGLDPLYGISAFLCFGEYVVFVN